MDKVDLQVEYKDFFEGLGDIGTYTYKFFDLFKVNLGNGEDDKGNKLVKGLHWSKDCSEEDLSDEQLKELKTYLKQVKSWIRKEQKNIKASECRRKMWFFMQKLLEYGAFTRGERREMILWMDNFNFLIGVKIVHNQDD
jgi:hypothetical protein